ncbi:hypothetical protein [Motilimonas eburnea]|uniref:hypothetical protein n=1 Tax=Motilimonas eburnea TaxID=1737488 RepID=UPI001E29F49E|nr:hypothetical protein [Motilimonas eburnea]MCE2572436.1 hypothetical protein [Motilimonas eburnea]
MKKAILGLLISLTSWGGNAGLIVNDYTMESRLFASYTHLDIATLASAYGEQPLLPPLVAEAKDALAATHHIGIDTHLMASNEPAVVSPRHPLSSSSHQELTLIQQMLGASAPLVKSEWLDFKNNFTALMGLSGQQGLNQALVFDPVLVSKPKDDFRWDRARVHSSSEGELSWPIHWLQRLYQYLVDPAHLVIILLVLSVIVFIKRRFFV